MADKKIGVNYDYLQNSLLNFVVDPRSADPTVTTLKQGQPYYNTTSDRLKIKLATAAVKTVAYLDDPMTPVTHAHPQSDITNLVSDLAGKQATITGAASTIVSVNLAANMSTITDANGKMTVGAATSIELSYLSGVTSAIQTQINNKVNTSAVGAANGVCPLGSDAKIPSTYIPGSIDDVLEAADLTALNALATAEKMSNRIYVALDTGKTYRWSGSAFVEISSSVAISTNTPQSVSTTAAAGSSSQAAAADHVHTIAADIVTNAMLANMPAKTIKANLTSGVADPSDVTVTTLAAELAGDSNIVGKYVFQNAAITPSGNVATWNITTLAAAKKSTTPAKWLPIVKVYNTISGVDVEYDVEISINQTSGVLTAKWNTLDNTAIAANTYFAVVLI